MTPFPPAALAPAPNALLARAEELRQLRADAVRRGFVRHYADVVPLLRASRLDFRVHLDGPAATLVFYSARATPDVRLFVAPGGGVSLAPDGPPLGEADLIDYLAGEVAAAAADAEQLQAARKGARRTSWACAVAVAGGLLMASQGGPGPGANGAGAVLLAGGAGLAFAGVAYNMWHLFFAP